MNHNISTTKSHYLTTPTRKQQQQSTRSLTSTPRCAGRVRRRPDALSSPRITRTPRTTLVSLSSSSAIKSKSRHLHHHVGADRFIPNRSRIDTSRARRALTFTTEEQRDDDNEETSRHTEEYKRQLRRVLFDDDDDSNDDEESSSLLALAGSSASSTEGSGGSTLTRANMTRNHHHPMDQDILRSPNHHHDRHWKAKNNDARSHHRTGSKAVVDLTRCFTLDMAGVDSSRDDLHVMSVGPRIAVGIEDTVHFDEWGVHSGTNPTTDSRPAPVYLPPLHLEHMGYVSALQWRYKSLVDCSSSSNNHNKYLLAVGAEDSVEVYNVERCSCWAQLTDHIDTITSLEWIHGDDGVGSDYELLASSSVGIRRYDLRLNMPEVFTYTTDLHSAIRDAPAAKMQLQPQNGNLMAAAIPGKGLVALWDLRYSRIPMQTMDHDKVKGLEFCPMHRNTLASGGQEGIRLWNVQAGTLRSRIDTKEPVTSLTWSPHRCELLAGFGRYLGIWSFSSSYTSSQRLCQWTQPNVGPVLAVERMNTNDGRVLSLHGSNWEQQGGNEMMICWKSFGSSSATTTMENRLNRLPLGAATLACSPVIR